MKKTYIILIVSFFLSFNVFAEFGRGVGNGAGTGNGNGNGNNGNGGGNGGNDVPIDTGVVYLLVGGALFGAWTLLKNKNIQEV